MPKDDLPALSLQSTVRLPSGHSMPRLGFGVYQARGEECRRAVEEALKAGYRHIDSAQAYHNEHHVGAAVLASGLPRASLFLTTKYMPPPSGSTEEEVYAQLIRSPSRFARGVDSRSPPHPSESKDTAYLDLLLLHCARGGPTARAAAWRAVARAKAEGWVRDVGVSNYGVKHLRELVALEVEGLPRPSVNQIELHPWCQQRDIVEFCNQHGITVQAYCPLVRAEPKRFNDPVLVDIAQRRGKEPAQVLIRWSLQKGYIPLPKSVTPARIASNADLYDFELSPEDMAALDALDEGAAGACSWNPVGVA